MFVSTYLGPVVNLAAIEFMQVQRVDLALMRHGAACEAAQAAGAEAPEPPIESEWAWSVVAQGQQRYFLLCECGTEQEARVVLAGILADLSHGSDLHHVKHPGATLNLN